MPISFIEPTKEEQEYIVSRMPDVSSLDDITKYEFERAMYSALCALDNVRTATINMGSVGQNHYFAIRALNTPSTPRGYKKGIQLVGQEYFGMNRFSQTMPDVADVEFWALYEGGDWELHTWNHCGEHLMVGPKGMGELKTGYLKINGIYLSPKEVISYVLCMKRRAEGNFARHYNNKTIDYTHSQLLKGQQPAERRLRQLQELNWLDENLEPTYILHSAYVKQTAAERKMYDKQLKLLREPHTFPSMVLGPHGHIGKICEFYNKNHIKALVDTKNPSYEDIQRFLQLERQCLIKFGFSLRDIHLLKDWPELAEYANLDAPAPCQNITLAQMQKDTSSLFQRIRKMLGV